MRLLAISDVHNNVSCVRKLRAQETNRFDAVIVAGDIGRSRSAEVFDILRTFACPVLFVNGNWDDGGQAAPVRGRWLKPLHLRLARVRDLSFVGYSFYPNGFSPGKKMRIPPGYSATCRAEIARMLLDRGVDARRRVLVSHDRATHLRVDFPGLLMHLYGHIHTHNRFERDGTTLVNVSALDRSRAVQRPGSEVVRYVNTGNYVVITVSKEGVRTVECRLLLRDYTSWKLLPRSIGLSFPSDGLFV